MSLLQNVTFIARQYCGRRCSSIRSPLSAHRATLKPMPTTYQRRWITEVIGTPSISNEASSISLKDGNPATVKESSRDNTEVQKSIGSMDWSQYHPAILRDACRCARCVDPFSGQKNFQTTDIPENLEIASTEIMPDGSAIFRWSDDIAGWDESHATSLPADLIERLRHISKAQDYHSHAQPRAYWDADRIRKSLIYVNYGDYMNNEDALYLMLTAMNRQGLVILRGVPNLEGAVEKIAMRIGTIRDTFYGHTWDVKSKPEAKNVAYTSQFLGLHMDLLYMAKPPGVQFLHCLKNTCEGGTSLFTDSWKAAAQDLSAADRNLLSTFELPYHYENAGEHYYFRHPVVELGSSTGSLGPRDRKHVTIRHVNYSPPFQDIQHPITDDLSNNKKLFQQRMAALRNFAAALESENNLFEYKLQEGECVIFNNRRVLHGRRQFSTAGGERWLKGTYIDTDAIMSRCRVLEANPAVAKGKKHRTLVHEYGGNVFSSITADSSAD
ncbi:hypothetical protein BJ878DRAFT_527904 [Calycina marina]|uniref:Gamma-butyrobetaine dioxygenase n=1 Tax=Calycina marina TaxID=1763456 RepID=A0A9P7YUU0_9HELO|nr:hypothetical protein BJ878DRAFT_527904 [Calycina marina]